MGDSNPLQSKKDIDKVLNASAEIPTEVKNSFADDEFDKEKFNKSLADLKKELQSTNEDKLKKLSRKDIINKLKGKYTGQKQSSEKSKFSLPVPPYEPAVPFTQTEIDGGNIFYLINEAAKVDTVDQLSRYLTRPEYDRSQFTAKRTFRVPAKFKDNTGGVVYPPGPTGPDDVGTGPDATGATGPAATVPAATGASGPAATVPAATGASGPAATVPAATGTSGPPDTRPAVNSLTNFSGRVNVKGNITISGTLDIESGDLQISGITPYIPPIPEVPYVESDEEYLARCADITLDIIELVGQGTSVIPYDKFLELKGKSEYQGYTDIELRKLIKGCGYDIDFTSGIRDIPMPRIPPNDANDEEDYRDARCMEITEDVKRLIGEGIREIPYDKFLELKGNSSYSEYPDQDLINLLYSCRFTVAAPVTEQSETKDDDDEHIARCQELINNLPSPPDVGKPIPYEDLLKVIETEKYKGYDPEELRILLLSCGFTVALPVATGPPAVLPSPQPLVDAITDFINKETLSMANEKPSLTYTPSNELYTNVQDILEKLQSEDYELITPDTKKQSKDSSSITRTIKKEYSNPYGIITVQLNRENAPKGNAWDAKIGKAEVQTGGKITVRKNYTFYILPKGRKVLPPTSALPSASPLPSSEPYVIDFPGIVPSAAPALTPAAPPAPAAPALTPAAPASKVETIEIDGKDLKIGDTVYLRKLSPWNKSTCLKLGDSAKIEKINKTLLGFQSGSVRVTCRSDSTGTTGDYSRNELSPYPIPPENKPARVILRPSTTERTDPRLRECKDSNGADIVKGNLVRAPDFPEGKTVKEIYEMTGGFCYVQLDDDHIIGSNLVELVVADKPPLIVESSESTEFEKRLASARSTLKPNVIPGSCLSSTRTPLNVGQIVKAPTSAGPILVQILQHLPNVRFMGSLSQCDILVKSVFEPIRTFVVTSWWLEPGNSNDYVLAQQEFNKRGNSNLLPRAAAAQPPPAAAAQTFSEVSPPPAPSTPDSTPLLQGECTLTNVGNTCFINAALQMLSHMFPIRVYLRTITSEQIDKLKTFDEPFRKALPENDKRKKLAVSAVNSNNIQIRKNALKQLKILFDVFEKNPNKEIDITKGETAGVFPALQSYINTLPLPQKYSKGQQLDAKELFEALIDLFTIFSADDFLYNTVVEYVLVDQRNDVNCNDGSKNTTNDLIPIIDLNIPTTTSPIKLSQILLDSQNADMLDENSRNIESCPGYVEKDGTIRDKSGTVTIIGKDLLDEKKKTERQALIDEAIKRGNATSRQRTFIPILEDRSTGNVVISIKRFIPKPTTKDPQNAEKIKIPVVPDKILTFGGKQYILKGVIVHIGDSASRGHYVYIQYKDGRYFATINDEKVDLSPLNEDQLNTGGYVFLYQKALKNNNKESDLHVYGGASTTGKAKGAKQSEGPKISTLADIGDLIDYTKAFAQFGLSKNVLKQKLEAILKLELSPGDTIEEFFKDKKLEDEIDSLTKTLGNKEFESGKLDTQITRKKSDIDKLTAEETAETDGKKKKVITDKLKKANDELKGMDKKGGELYRDIQRLNAELTTKQSQKIRLFNSGAAGKKIFESPKKTDDEIISELASLSKIGLAIVPLIEKLTTLKQYIDTAPPVSETDLEDLTSKIVKIVNEDKNNVNFNLTPLQYAVLVANKLVVEELIKNNVPVNLRETITDRAPDGTYYTLEALANERDSQKDTRKQDVLTLTVDIKRARDKAVSDYNRVPPQVDKAFLDKNKGNEVITLVYRKIYQEYAQGKGGPDSGEIDIDEIRYKEQIDKAKEDAKKLDPKTKIQGIPDSELYRPLEWKAQSASLRAESAVYTKYYDLARASIQGEQDGKRKPAKPSPEYDGIEYNTPPLRAIKDAYITAFRRASAEDFDRGFYDGLAGKPVSTYVEGLPFLEADWMQTLLESSGSSISNISTTGLGGTPGFTNTAVRDRYKQGYLIGITQLITPNPSSPAAPTIATTSEGYYDTVKAAAEAAGVKDALNSTSGVQKYTTPAGYYAADTRFTTSPIDRSKKDIPIQVFVNKMISNYPEFALEPGATPQDKAEALARQAKINDLKTAYDDAYSKTMTSRVQGLSPPSTNPPLKPATVDLPPTAGTRKRKALSTKRRTLRKK